MFIVLSSLLYLNRLQAFSIIPVTFCRLTLPCYHSMAESLFWLSGFSTAIAGFLLLLFLPLLRWVLSTFRPQNFPPGPPTIPGLGNLHQIPPSKPFLKFHEWSKQYGDLVSLKMAANNLVIINSPKIVRM